MNKSFGEKLLKLKYRAIQMQYNLAYLNTIGGAYHLCHKPGTALVIAKRQENLAKQIGSSALLIRSRGFQAINMGLLGKYSKAQKLLESLTQQAKLFGHHDLVNFLIATSEWLRSFHKKPQK
jgi:hypothetical protein